jgi:hypothetical protein
MIAVIPNDERKYRNNVDDVGWRHICSCKPKVKMQGNINSIHIVFDAKNRLPAAYMLPDNRNF